MQSVQMAAGQERVGEGLGTVVCQEGVGAIRDKEREGARTKARKRTMTRKLKM
jgi:hypothetical protein